MSMFPNLDRVTTVVTDRSVDIIESAGNFTANSFGVLDDAAAMVRSHTKTARLEVEAENAELEADAIIKLHKANLKAQAKLKLEGLSSEDDKSEDSDKDES